MALSADRNTPERPRAERYSLPVKAAAKIYAGALVCLNSSGVAVAGAVATTLIAIGRAEAAADNSAGADGAINVDVRRGVFRFANSTSSDAIAQTDIGTTCYVVDDQTVAKTNGSSARSAAGKVFDVDAQGVWVDFNL